MELMVKVDIKFWDSGEFCTWEQEEQTNAKKLKCLSKKSSCAGAVRYLIGVKRFFGNRKIYKPVLINRAYSFVIC